MSKGLDPPDMDDLDVQDDEEDVEDLFASPSNSGATTQKHTPNSQASSAQKYHSRTRSHNEHEAREARLRAELEKVREVNKVITNVTASLVKAKDNMETVNRTVDSASTLLATWTRILSQTEHNQRLILNPNWHGATQDVEDMENEDARRQQEAEKRARDEQRRKDEAQRRVEEEERRKAAAVAAPRGRGAGRARGTRGVSGSTREYVGVGGQAGRWTGTSGAKAGASSGTGQGRSDSRRARGRGLG